MTVTHDMIVALFNAMDVSQAKFAEQIGSNSSAVSAYIGGVYLPKKPDTVSAIMKLYKRYIGGRAFTDPKIGEFNTERLVQAQEHSGMTGVAIAEELGISTITWYKWVKGENYPTKSVAIAALRRWLKANEPQLEPQESAVDSTNDARRPRISAERSLALTTEFYEQHQLDLNRQMVSKAIGFIADKEGVEKKKAYDIVMSFMVLMKDKLSYEQTFTALTGHDA